MFGRSLPWRREAEETGAWLAEAQRNLAAAELDVRRTRTLLDKSLEEALGRVEETIASSSAPGSGSGRLEGVVDTLEGGDARTTERRLERLEYVLQVKLGRVPR